jgi:hypothetical protein
MLGYDFILITQATSHCSQDILPPVSEADGRNILNSLETIKPGILTGLTTLVAKRPAFDAFFLLGASAIVLATLEQLATAVAALEIAMLALAPVCFF